jgi:orotate phosphoribosyltransferase
MASKATGGAIGSARKGLCPGLPREASLERAAKEIEIEKLGADCYTIDGFGKRPWLMPAHPRPGGPVRGDKGERVPAGDNDNLEMKREVLLPMKERLKELILEYAFQFSETPSFKLAHGGVSQFYFNCKRVTLDPEGQYLIGNLAYEALSDLGVQAVGGLTLGADPISNAVAYTSWVERRPIQSFVVRKKQKDHGIVSLIEGKVQAGDRVVVVDDVVTTGGSTLQAIAACRQAGLEVVRAIVLVDRQEMNGRESILKEVPDFRALVTREEIMDLYRAKY